MARTAATEPEPRITAYTAASPVSANQAAATPPSGASSKTPSAATAPPRSEARSRGSCSGTCAPTVNINMAKPTSPRNCTVGSVGSTAPNPVRPTITPARISPITTGTNTLPPAPSSGPARPASTINASTPKVTVPGYAAARGPPMCTGSIALWRAGVVHPEHQVRSEHAFGVSAGALPPDALVDPSLPRAPAMLRGLASATAGPPRTRRTGPRRRDVRRDASARGPFAACRARRSARVTSSRLVELAPWRRVAARVPGRGG